MFRRKHWKLHKFLFPIQKEVTRIDNKRKEITKHMSYRLQFIDSAKFMEAYYQVLLIIMLKEFITLNVNTNTMIKKCETWGIKYKYWDCVIENTSFKDGLVEY